MKDKLMQIEQYVLVMLLEGYSPKEIADSLKIDLALVQFHQERLYRKFDVSNDQELIAKYQTEIEHNNKIKDKLMQIEQYILVMFLEGYSPKEIADSLTIDLVLVQFHQKRLYRKFDVSNNPELIAKYQAEIEQNNKVKEELTRRQYELFKMLLDGAVPKEIANNLKIATETVQSHQTHLYRKLGVCSVDELRAKYTPKFPDITVSSVKPVPAPEPKKSPLRNLMIFIPIPTGILIIVLLFVLFLKTSLIEFQTPPIDLSKSGLVTPEKPIPMPPNDASKGKLVPPKGSFSTPPPLNDSNEDWLVAPETNEFDILSEN